MKKVIIGSLMAISVLLGCKKKEKEPVEFFRFTANGVDYFYPQIKGTAFVGDWKTLNAGIASGNLGYIIGANSREEPSAPGQFIFFLNENQVLTDDTIILDGLKNKVIVKNFLSSEDNYLQHSELPGQIVFTEKSAEKIAGFFEFDAELYRTPSLLETIWTDTILHITNGQFSIIPSH